MVPALGRLDAAGAAGPANALGNHRQGGLPESIDNPEPFLGYPHSPRMPVIYENLGFLRVRVKGSRNAPDIIAVAQCEEGQHPDGGVLSRMKPARQGWTPY